MLEPPFFNQKKLSSFLFHVIILIFPGRFELPFHYHGFSFDFALLHMASNTDHHLSKKKKLRNKNMAASRSRPITWVVSSHSLLEF